MRKSNSETLGVALEAFFKKSGFYAKIKEEEVKQNCLAILQPHFSKYVTKITFKNGVVFLTVQSAVIKQELALHKSQIIKRLNEMSGMEIVKDIFV